MPRHERIRPDLWNAILDYSSGRKYVWVNDEAKPLPPGEDPAAGAPTIPTVSQGEYVAWKSEFASSLDPKRLDERAKARIGDWAKDNLPTSVLPKPIQGLWNATLKGRVRERLTEWFSGLDRASSTPPPDLIVEQPATGSTTQPADLALVRALAAECVSGMSWRELSELKLPATSLLRIGERILGGDARLELLNACRPEEQRHHRGSKANPS